MSKTGHDLRTKQCTDFSAGIAERLSGGVCMEFPVIDLTETGKRIKVLCKKADLKPSEIKKQLCLSCVQTVYKWFSGENIPSIENFYALSLMLGVSMEDLIVLKNKPDHSRFWQKNTYILSEANDSFLRRMLFYRSRLACV